MNDADRPSASAWVTPQQAATLLGISDRQVRNHIRDDLIGAVDHRAPGASRARWLILRSSIEDFLTLRSNDGMDGNAAGFEVLWVPDEVTNEG